MKFHIAIIFVFMSIFNCGCLHIYTETEIQAPPEEVWAVLTDFPAYPTWNPYHVSIEGTFEKGERIKLHIIKPNGNSVHIRPRIQRIDAGRELIWGGGLPLIFVGRHVFRLRPTANGGTHLVQEERFRGIAVPFAELDTIKAGYQAVNQSLRRHVEDARSRKGAPKHSIDLEPD